jgi:hypothetical protein
VVIILRPLIEWMIVAPGTLQARSEKYLGNRLGPCLGIAQCTIEIGGRIDVSVAPRRDEFTSKFIKRLAVRDALANPIVKNLDALAVERLFLVPQHI